VSLGASPRFDFLRHRGCVFFVPHGFGGRRHFLHAWLILVICSLYTYVVGLHFCRLVRCPVGACPGHSRGARLGGHPCKRKPASTSKHAFSLPAAPYSSSASIGASSIQAVHDYCCRSRFLCWDLRSVLFISVDWSSSEIFIQRRQRTSVLPDPCSSSLIKWSEPRWIQGSSFPSFSSCFQG
jgi:hypothetical protein